MNKHLSSSTHLAFQNKLILAEHYRKIEEAVTAQLSNVPLSFWSARIRPSLEDQIPEFVEKVKEDYNEYHINIHGTPAPNL